MKKILLTFLLFSSLLSFATHNRAGEILYKRVAPYTAIIEGVSVPVFNYSITVITYTDDGPQVADRCEDTVYFGDGERGIANRINGGSNCGGGCAHCGSLTINESNYKVKINIYTIMHQYAGAGSYKIQMFDPNRNGGVHNITNSDQQPFYLESLLIINNISGANSSPIFYNPPTDKACLGKCFYHNPGAYDVDGDSLSFELTTSRGVGGTTVPGYFYPETGSGGVFNINAVTGLLTWCTPQLSAEYNLAFIVREWRKNSSGNYQLIGYVLRDMQVIVVNCPLNFPPIVVVPADTCVEAGAVITKRIYVTDPPTETSRVILSATSGASAAVTPIATLGNYIYTNTPFAPFSAEFNWTTTCDHVRLQPYQTVFKVADTGPGSPLVSFATYNIKVVPPSVKNVSATPVGSTIKITWSPSTCNPSENPLIAYKVYRKNDCSPFIHDPCKTGVDPTSGFLFIGQTTANIFSFIDDNKGNGLVVGQNYSYLVIATYTDKTQSFGNTQVCSKLKRDIPVLLNVDVRSTSPLAGSVFVRWSKPLTNTGNLDTTKITGPYQFVLKYRSGRSGNFTPIQTYSSNYFLNLDTSFLHSGINTLDSTAFYVVDFLAGNLSNMVGSSPLASSIFLKAESGDRKIKLSWSQNTPWNNYKYTVQRRHNTALVFTTIGTTWMGEYIDSVNVVNRNTYCYRIIGEGKYSDPSVFKPLINYSQEVCALAKDLTIPCTPVLSVDADCPTGFVRVKWNDVRAQCSDDVIKYVLFFKSTINDPYQEVDTIAFNTTSYTYDGLTLISGCYAIQSVDSSGNASIISPDFCIDNCPEFELPNVFTPNNDKVNDFFKAIKVRQIKEIDLSVFDRWGNLVYKTTDPYFQWDGTSLQSKKSISEGTFFYICEVFEPRLTGLRKRTLKGYVQMIR